jgi:hypothetical protein
MAEEDDIAKEAFGATTVIGGGIAAVGGVASAAAGVAVAGAAAVGVGIGMGIEYATDGAISDTLSDGLLGLVGDEESLAAANAFDDGNYIEGAGHMLSGAGETIGEAASDAYDYVSEGASDAYDYASDVASDAYDTASDFVSDVGDFLNPFY